MGRAVSVGPKLKIHVDEGSGEMTLSQREDVDAKAIWEIYPLDLDDTDLFQRNMIGILNRAVEMRGWAGWAGDMVGAVRYRIAKFWGT